MNPASSPRPHGPQDGATILEATVAVALFVTVLVPLGAMTTTFVLRSPSAADAEALRLARQALESSLSGDMLAPGDTTHAEGPWRIHRSIVREGDLVLVTVRVGRTADARPRATLRSIRPSPR